MVAMSCKEAQVTMFSTETMGPIFCGDAEVQTFSVAAKAQMFCGVAAVGTLSLVERAQMFCGVAVVGMIFQGLAVMTISMAAMGLTHWMEVQVMTGCGAARRPILVLVKKFTNARVS